MSSEIKSRIFNTIEEYCSQNHNFSFNSKSPSIKLHEPTFGAEEINASLEPMLSTMVTMGSEVRKFERQYADYNATKYGVMNNSGSSANLLAISALVSPVTENRLFPGDEVIVPALSWSTTIWPLVQHGLVPVFVDCDINTFNFDFDKLEKSITKKTRAIMLVHVYGNPCDMDKLMEIAEKYKLQIIEDSCESMGANYKGKPVGSFGRVGTFSFYFSHHITTLEGGICVTSDYDFSENMKIIRAHGWSRESEYHSKYVAENPNIDPRFIFVNLGYNIRPTECQAKMGQVQLKKLDGFVKKRREAVELYKKYFAEFEKYFTFQRETENAYSSWFGFSVVLKSGTPFRTKEIGDYLRKYNIENRPVIAGNMSVHPAMKMFNYLTPLGLENSNYLMANAFAVASHQFINEEAVVYTRDIIRKFLKEGGF